MTKSKTYGIIFGQSEDSRFKITAKLPAEERYKIDYFCVFLHSFGFAERLFLLPTGKIKLGDLYY